MSRILPRWLRVRLSRKILPKLLIDAVLLAFCYPAAYWLRTSGEPPAFLDTVLKTTLLLVPIKLGIMAYFGQYRFMWGEPIILPSCSHRRRCRDSCRS